MQVQGAAPDEPHIPGAHGEPARDVPVRALGEDDAQRAADAGRLREQREGLAAVRGPAAFPYAVVVAERPQVRTPVHDQSAGLLRTAGHGAEGTRPIAASERLRRGGGGFSSSRAGRSESGCGLSVRWCVIGGMAIVLGKPGVDGLSEAVGVLREWQYDGAPMQLHPGDLGWFWRFGAEATAAAVRTWSRDGRILAVGLLDGPGLLRLTIAPDAQRDEELARAAGRGRDRAGARRAARGEGDRRGADGRTGPRSAVRGTAGTPTSRGRRCAATSRSR